MGLNNFLYGLAMRVALRRRAPNNIPMSLPRSAKNDFFQVNLSAFDKDPKGFYVLDDVGSHYEGIYFPFASGGGHKARIAKETVHTHRIHIRHYLKGYEFVSASPALFLLRFISGFNYIFVFFDRSAQYFFNRRRLARRDRIEILRMFVRKTIERSDYSVGPAYLVKDLHSMRTFSHPEFENILAYYRLILESFAKTEDLKEDRHGTFSITGKGVATLATYELEERRFHENLRQQKLVVRLTIAVIIVGLLQAAATYFAESGPSSSWWPF